MMAMRQPLIEFWFDPTCPHTWRTSRWLADVAARRALEVEWGLMSLAILNEGREAPQRLAEKRRRSVPVLQALEAVRDKHGTAALGAVYGRLGVWLHDQGAALDVPVVARALAATGITDLALDEKSLAGFQGGVSHGHAEAQRRAGMEAGSPLIAIDGGRAFFGPVLAQVPGSDEAGQIFDGLVTLTRCGSFSELKGSRETPPLLTR
jgi:hypothetical protein